MAKPTWTPHMLTGDADVDRQHEQLFALADELGIAARRGADRIALGHAMFSLLRYAKVHFEAEEALMERASYPGIDLQREQHAAFALRCNLLANSCVTQRSLSPEVLHRTVIEWLVDHVTTEDRAFAEFMQLARTSA